MKRVHFIYKTFAPLLRPFIIRKYNLTGDKIELPKGPNLILANHVTNVDFLFLIAMARCELMQFVLAENITRNKLFKGFLKFISDPVIHIKGSNAISTIREMNERFKYGQSVLLFPEGNTTFDGCTAYVGDSTSKLVKLSKANLVMVKITGGYLSRPRWGIGLRKGKINIESACVMADEIKRMSVMEITDTINRNLYTDAYEENKTGDNVYIGKKPCLGIERAMYQCPVCQKIGTLKSSALHVTCECGYQERMDEHGYLVDGNSEAHSVKEYVTSQKEYINNRIIKAKENKSHELLFADDVQITDITDRKNKRNFGQLKIYVYTDGVTFGNNDGIMSEMRMNLNAIRNITIFKANRMTAFIDNAGNGDIAEKVYEIDGGFSFNALKYRDLFEIITDEV